MKAALLSGMNADRRDGLLSPQVNRDGGRNVPGEHDIGRHVFDRDVGIRRGDDPIGEVAAAVGVAFVLRPHDGVGPAEGEVLSPAIADPGWLRARTQHPVRPNIPRLYPCWPVALQVHPHPPHRWIPESAHVDGVLVGGGGHQFGVLPLDVACFAVLSPADRSLRWARRSRCAVGCGRSSWPSGSRVQSSAWRIVRFQTHSASTRSWSRVARKSLQYSP